MRGLIENIPDAETIIALSPEELGASLIFVLRNDHRKKQFHPRNEISGFLTMSRQLGNYPAKFEHEVMTVLTEAFAWLETEGLIIPAPATYGDNGWRSVSRKGHRLKDEDELLNLASARKLPKGMLHASLHGSVWISFARGDFATAAFQAMREVEIAVRDAAGYTPGDYGVRMVRDAFNVQNGPLSDPSSENAERQALSDLFAGAIGSYKNPHSHRRVPMDDPTEAAEIVLLASHLLKIVDSRR